MEWRVQFKAQPHNFNLTQMNEWGDDFYCSVFRAGLNHAVEGFIIGGTAVGIAGAVLFDGADNNFLRSQNLGPAHRGGQEMRVAKGNVGDRNIVAHGMSGRGGRGYGDVFIGEGGASNGTQSLIAEQEFVLNIQALANGQERLALTRFSALAVADVQGRGIVIAACESRADTGIHASA